MEEITIQAFLLWLSGVAGSGVAASWILERIPAFQLLAAETKKWVFFGSVAALMLGGHLTLTYVPAETLAMIAPYFAILASAFLGVFSGEAFHRFDREG